MAHSAAVEAASQGLHDYKCTAVHDTDVRVHGRFSLFGDANIAAGLDGRLLCFVVVAGPCLRAITFFAV